MQATFNQRELGIDFDSYVNGLRAALRQAPKVILVGEMRDQDTVKIALSAAETGHLVLSTLHTINAGETINRILGMFEPEEQEQIRVRLADSLRWIISQRLVPKVGGARFALLEIMGANLRTQEAIRLGESEGKTFYEIIESSYPFGWRTFDHACMEAYEQGIISEETALLYCTKRSVISRAIDNVKKARGEMTTTIGSLRMKAVPAARSGSRATRPQNQIIMNGSFDFVSTEDKPALIAFSTPEWLDAAEAALSELGYKVHTAATHSDFLVRFGQAHYQVVIIEELFGANTIDENLTLKALQTMPVNQRRHATIILLGDSFQTFTPMEAFQHSVHAVINSFRNVLAQATGRKGRGRQRTVPAQLPRSPNPRLYQRQPLVMPSGVSNFRSRMKPRRPTLKVCFRSFSFFLLAISSVQAKEPYYKGKSLSDWLSYDLGADAPAAIQQMGTNAIPTLLDLMGATPKTIRWVAVRLDSKRMREQLRNDDGDVYFGEIKEAVVLAFTVLGTNAESAVPKMVKFLDKDNDDVSIYAAAALGVVGPKGFAALTNALNSPNPSIRVDVAIGISKSGQGFKLLIALLKDQDQRVREVTVNSLGNADPALAIPALVPLLDDKEPDMRQSAAGALSNYGPKAKSAAPKILSLYTNSQDGEFFVDLKRIDLETARKAEALVVNNGPLNPNRQGYTKTMMKNGLELIAGGYVHTELQSVNNHFLSSAEIYDPENRDMDGDWRNDRDSLRPRSGFAVQRESSGDRRICWQTASFQCGAI